MRSEVGDGVSGRDRWLGLNMKEDVHETVLRYRDCARGIWNVYLRNGADWDTEEAFGEIDASLFQLIFLNPVGLGRVVDPGQSCGFLVVEIAEPVAPVLVRRPSSEGTPIGALRGGGWGM